VIVRRAFLYLVTALKAHTFLTITAAAPCAYADEEPPVEWIEPQTGHRVVRLSREPGSSSLYFHQYAFSADGKNLVITTRGGISTIDLETRKVEPIVRGRVRVLVTGRKTGDVYYLRDGAVWAATLDTHEARRVAALPEGLRSGNVAVNADETVIVGVAVDPDGEAKPRATPSGGRERGLAGRWAAGLPMVMYTVEVASGATEIIHRSNDWLNHLQCSPTDPNQILFCHEGPWHYVDRVWLIRTDGSDLRLVHPRTMDMEIAGHEFFSNDGKTIWYDLQTPRSLVFWLAAYDIESGSRTWYHHERQQWSVHYNISPDGSLVAGDGGGPDSVANMTPSRTRLDPPGNGQWIYLFRPELIAMKGLAEKAAKQVKIGVLRAERLVDMSQHDYELEPNVMFTPDGKWIVFRSNMHGPTHTYAVEVARANEPAGAAGE
jgi:oligogalacturonide lyase